MIRNPRIEEFEIDTKPRRPSKQTFGNFLYNEDTGAYLGRTPSSWGESMISNVFELYLKPCACILAANNSYYH